MNDIAKKIKAIAALGLDPCLKKTGFRKNGTHFSRTDGNALEIINVQSSQWNNSSSGKFTLNVGVHFSAVAKMLQGTDPMPAIPKEHYCLIRRRVGMLLPAGCDHWWTVTPETEVESVAAEVTSALKGYVLPWLEKVRTISTAADELENARAAEFWTAAAARLVLGEPERAARLVEMMIESLGTDRDGAHPANADLTAKHIQDLRKWAAHHQLPGFVKA